MSAPNDQGINTVTWRPHVTQVGNLPRPTSQLVEPNLVTNTSLKHNQPPYKPIGSSHNTSAKPFGSYALVHKQYNSPINLFSNKNIAETINAHSEILAPGVVGINFMKQDAPVNKESDVYKAILEEEAAKNQKKGTGAQFGKQYGLPTNSGQVKNQATPNELNPPFRFEELPRTSPTLQSQSFKRLQHILGDDATTSTTRHVEAPTAKPNVAPNQTIESNVCSECGRLIVGIFCKIKDRKLHEECFKCSTCGTSLKNQGYFNINEKLYCEIHIQQAAQASHSPTRIITPNCTTVRPKESVSKPTSPAFQMNKPNFSSQQSATSSKPNSPAINVSWTENQNLDPKLSQQQPSQINYSNTASTLKTSLNKNLYQSVPHPYPGPGKDTFKPSSTTISAPKFSWPSKTMVESSETVKTVYSSSTGDTVSNTYSSNYSNSYDDYQQVQNSNLNNFEKMKINDTATSKKIPPNTLPKPNLGPNWQSHSLNKTTNTTQYKQSLTSSGQSSITGSRPAPRRGRGQLKSLELGARVPVCANSSCCQQIRGPFISALGKTWCPEHFVCAHSSCRRSLQDCGFVEEKGILYCESCFELHFAPSCANCHQRIKGDCLIALDKQYHPECFVCSYCKKVFANTSFYLEDGLPYCEKDWNELFTTKCIACNLPIAAGDRWVEALNNNYHSQCFKCTLCGVNLEGQSFYARNGQAFCKLHASRPN